LNITALLQSQPQSKAEQIKLENRTNHA